MGSATVRPCQPLAHAEEGEVTVTTKVGSGTDRCWVQVGVNPREGEWPRLYAELAELARDLLAEPSVTNFFFMHKPPGLRVRFETTADQRLWLVDTLDRRLDRWGTLIDPVSPGVYEPEEQLFGGPGSMPHVHRLFTVDARAWLGFHQLASPKAAWAFSLALLRQMLDGLAILGWEDLDVWERIRRQAGRSLPAGLDTHRVAVAAREIRALWADHDRLRRCAPGRALALVDELGPELRAAGQAWYTGYFGQRGATIGPREGAAFATIFHWNRGRLPAGTQAILATALADRAARP
jgi:thiopeptide-type bacteriocin biosynthesis protein